MRPATREESEPAALPVESVLEAFRNEGRRRLFLDYDGTLVGFVSRPEDAAPSSALCRALCLLAGDLRNDLIVISGRRRSDLERWLGAIPGLWLAAEHGAFLRPPGSEWRSAAGSDTKWKDRVRPVLRYFTTRTPGSFIEEKEHCLVWHFRESEPKFAEPRSRELAAGLKGLLAGTGLRVLQGRKIVEVKPSAFHKGKVVDAVSAECGFAGFCFAAGDDQTDEDLFTSMPAGSWTVHVGTGRSSAKYHLAGPAEMHNLLAGMSDSSPRPAGFQ